MKSRLLLLVLSGWVLGGGVCAAQSIDGSCHKNAGTGGTSQTCSLTTTQANDVIGCVTTVNGGVNPNISGIASTNTTGWARRAVQGTGGGNLNAIETWYGTAASALSAETITVSFNNSVGFTTIDCFGISGADTTTIFDSNAALPNKATTAPRSATTSNANDIIIGAFRQASTASPTAGAGWTLISGANFQIVEYKVVTATQSGLSVTESADADVNAAIADAIMSSGGSPPASTRGMPFGDVSTAFNGGRTFFGNIRRVMLPTEWIGAGVFGLATCAVLLFVSVRLGTAVEHSYYWWKDRGYHYANHRERQTVARLRDANTQELEWQRRRN